MHLKGKCILITGGTGSLGKAITRFLTSRNHELQRLIIFSRDEQKQFQMAQQYPVSKYPFIRYFIGDVRDLNRLTKAFQRVDYVIHAAAMKHVPIAEYNPTECIDTNINGARNVIEASLLCSVSKVVALSTDKACAPINLYGATKLTSDKLFVSANNIIGKTDISFSVVRYGNVMGSNGSVIPFYLNLKKQKLPLQVTHPGMTRFNISIEEGVKMIFESLAKAHGGEIFIPKLPSYRILDLVEAISPNSEYELVGIRPGEKIHEEMVAEADSVNTYEFKNNYIIIPENVNWNVQKFVKNKKGRKVKEGFRYNSGNNTNFESVASLRNKIKLHVCPEFEA